MYLIINNKLKSLANIKDSLTLYMEVHDFHQKLFFAYNVFSEHFRQKVSLREGMKVVFLYLLSQKPPI